jgi:dihydroorotase
MSNDAPAKIGKLLLKGGRVFDPVNKLDTVTDVLIDKGKIQKIGSVSSQSFSGKVIDCKDKLVVPGLTDMHVHLREPGREDQETILTGCNAAMAGGFTAVCCMPNTEPPIDCRGQVEFIKERSEGFLVDVHPIAAVTVEREGDRLTEMGELVEAGAVGFSDDGTHVKDGQILRRALEYANMFGVPIIDHCEDPSLSESGAMNEGFVSTVLGLKGIPSISEELDVARDLLIAEFTGGRIHIAHVSTRGSVQLIREAKSRGVAVTAETCPHYLVLTDESVRTFDTNTKMKPPLRTEADQKALIQGLKDGTIDAIASDHAPHAIEEKDVEYDAAAFGIVGLETSVGLILTHLVEKGILTLGQMLEKMSINPARILGLKSSHLLEGEAPSLTLIDPNLKWKVDKNRFLSKSRNTPFDGWEVKGKPVGVINHGQIFCPGID